MTQQLSSFKPKSQKLFKLGLPFLIFGHLINYLLTEFAFRTVRYEDLGPYARTSQARSVLQDLGLNILLYEKQTRLINSNDWLVNHVPSSIKDKASRVFKTFMDKVMGLYNRVKVETNTTLVMT